MSSNQNIRHPNSSSQAPSLPSVADRDDGPEIDATPSSNDNAALLALADTTAFAARPDVVRGIRTTLRSFRVPTRDMEDGIADVQTEAIAHARRRGMPATVARWKALTTTIARRWALDRRRAAKVRKKYDAGFCEDPDAYLSPTLHWEQRDPVDTKRYLALLKELFDSGQMPEDGQAILQDAADEVPQADTAAELGITENTVKKRLVRMRARFRARLVTLGMMTLMMLLLLSSLVGSVGGVAAPAPSTQTTEEAPSVRVEPAADASAPDGSENRPRP
jgi:DNA-directed RNA polymerase specialized sigma24 family protein